MLSVTPRFLAALRQTHTVSVAAAVYRPSAPDVPIMVPVVGGDVTIDIDARVRRQATLEVAFALNDPTARDTIGELPYGGTATIERGIRYADGTTERVQLGLFRVESIVWRDAQGLATLTLADRMAQIQDEPLLSPWAPAGFTASDAVFAAVHAIFGDAISYHVETDPASEPLLADVVYDSDQAAAIADLASSVAAEALFDNQGDFVLRPRGGTGPVAWTIDAAADGVLVSAEETLDRSTVRNGVLVRGQPAADQAPFQSLVVYDDPDSPVRWDGPFGHVALVTSSTAVTTQEQAAAAAASLLNLRLGLSRTMTIESVPNPALEPGDLIEIVHSDGRVETQTINSARIGLDVTGTLQLTAGTHTQPDLEPAAVRTYIGERAWRELEGARLVAA